MAVERVPFDFDYLVNEYRTGRSFANLAREVGVSPETIRVYLRDAGCLARKPCDAASASWRCGRTRVTAPPGVIDKYLGGSSELALAEEFGVGRHVIRRVLLESGIAPRGRSAAGKTRASRMTPAERKAQAAAAHRAATGRKKTFAEMCLAARTRQTMVSHISASELELAAMLVQRNIEVIRQQAIGPYNCDLGANPVAVEIFGGQWHWTGHHLRRTCERFNYILNAGWHIIAIPVNNTSPLTPAVADYVAAFIERARRDPTLRREYRVVWRAGEFVTTGNADDNNLSIIPPFTCRQNLATGQYETIPR